MSANEPKYCPISTLLSIFAVICRCCFPGQADGVDLGRTPSTAAHDQGLDWVLRDPLPDVARRMSGPGPHVRQVDRVDPVCRPARAPHVLPFHSGLAGLFLPGHAELADMYSKPICALDIAMRSESAIYPLTRRNGCHSP